MQLKKQNWKRLRAESPCRQCGHNHKTTNCVQRDGKKRFKPTDVWMPFHTANEIGI